MTSIGKNPSSTLARDKAKIEYISEGQPSPYELAFGIELGQNPHSKMVSESILDSLNGSPPSYRRTNPKVLGAMGCIGKNPSPTSTRDNAKIKYISGGNSHPMN